jgi:hypothetical protein
MSEPVQRRDDAVIIDGGHPDVSANAIENQNTEGIYVHVKPASDLIIQLFAEGDESPQAAYYEGMLAGKRVRFEVMLDESKISSSENFARFKAVSEPQLMS